MTNLSLAYQSIVSSLNLINKGDAREFSIVWNLPLSARIVCDDSHIYTIRVDDPLDLDIAVAEYLIEFAANLTRKRGFQQLIGKPCPL